MKIMSLNVNQFAGMGEIEDTKYLQELNSYAREIVSLVKKFLLENDTGIVILQEIPCYGFGHRRTVYDCFCAEFAEELYKIFVPANVKANIITMGIANKNGGWKEEKEGIVNHITDFKNKLVELSNSDGGRLIGVHMPIDPKNEKENKKFWRDVCLYLQNSSRRPDLAGDFNAHEGDCDYREQYKAILDAGYQDMVPENAVTFVKGGRGIDHILVPAGKVFPEAEVLPVSFSDHAAVVGTV